MNEDQLRRLGLNDNEINCWINVQNEERNRQLIKDVKLDLQLIQLQTIIENVQLFEDIKRFVSE